MASPQLRAISVSLAGSELLRAAKSHFDRLQCLSRATSQPSRAMTSLHEINIGVIKVDEGTGIYNRVANSEKEWCGLFYM